MAVQELPFEPFHIRDLAIIRSVVVAIGHQDLVEVLELYLVGDQVFEKYLQTFQLSGYI